MRRANIGGLVAASTAALLTCCAISTTNTLDCEAECTARAMTCIGPALCADPVAAEIELDVGDGVAIASLPAPGDPDAMILAWHAQDPSAPEGARSRVRVAMLRPSAGTLDELPPVTMPDGFSGTHIGLVAAGSPSDPRAVLAYRLAYREESLFAGVYRASGVVAPVRSLAEVNAVGVGPLDLIGTRDGAVAAFTRPLGSRTNVPVLVHLALDGSVERESVVGAWDDPERRLDDGRAVELAALDDGRFAVAYVRREVSEPTYLLDVQRHESAGPMDPAPISFGESNGVDPGWGAIRMFGGADRVLFTLPVDPRDGEGGTRYGSLSMDGDRLDLGPVANDEPSAIEIVGGDDSRSIVLYLKVEYDVEDPAGCHPAHIVGASLSIDASSPGEREPGRDARRIELASVGVDEEMSWAVPIGSPRLIRLSERRLAVVWTQGSRVVWRRLEAL